MWHSIPIACHLPNFICLFFVFVFASIFFGHRFLFFWRKKKQNTDNVCGTNAVRESSRSAAGRRNDWRFYPLQCFLFYYCLRGERWKDVQEKSTSQKLWKFQYFYTKLDGFLACNPGHELQCSIRSFFVYSKHFLCLIIHFEKQKQNEGRDTLCVNKKWAFENW